MKNGAIEALKGFAELYNHQGVSVWHFNDGMLSLCAEWTTVRRNEHLEEYVRQGFENKADIIHLDHLHLFFEQEWGVAFYGQGLLNDDEFKRSLPFFIPWFKLLERAKNQEMQESSFQSLLRVAETIVSSIHSDRMLDLILETAIHTISAADTGFLFLYDEKINKLRVRSAVGFRKESYTYTRLAPGEGISGRVFESNLPVIISGMDNIKASMSNMTPVNYQYYIDSTIYSVFPHSVISVPLLYQDRPIGVLTLDNFLKEEFFTVEDLKLLQAFANLSAVVIESARLFQQVQKQNDELYMMHQALSKEHESLQKTFDFHNELTNIAAKGRGMEEILAALYQAVKVPVAVFDRLMAPVSSFPRSEDLQLPDHFLMHPSMKLVNQTRKWQRLDWPEKDQTIIVIPVIGTDRLLGYLCAWISAHEFIDIGKIIFEYSATVIALEWIKKEAIQESQELTQSELLENVLAGEISPKLLEQTGYLGFRQDDYYAVFLIKSGKTSREEYYAWKESVYGWLEANNLAGLIVRRGQREVMIISFSASMSGEKRTKMLRSVMRDFPGREELEIGIGRIHCGLDNVKKSFKEASQCLDLFKLHHPQETMLYYGDLGVIRFFLKHDREELKSYLHEYLGPLLEYEQAKNKDFLNTLLVYVQHDKDLGKVTKELNIHYNTLYYRIKRIQEILGYSFERSEDWLNVKLACQIYSFLNE